MIAALLRGSLAAAALAVGAAPASADAFPTKPVHIIVPFGSGGVTDLFARQLAERITPALGQQVVVENRTGQGGAIGAAYVAKAQPDGHVILLAGSANVIGHSLYKNLTFSIVDDFTPIVRTATLVNVLVVHPSSKFGSVRDIIQAAKAQPGKLTYSSSGSGGHYHLAMEMLKSLAKVDILHVPYKTESAGRVDLIAGRTDMMITAFGAAQSNLKQNQLKVLAVTSDNRFPGLPDTPTIAEAGVPGYEGDAWIGLMAPAGTPAEPVKRIHAEVTRQFADPGFRAKLAQQGIRAVESTPAQFASFLKEDILKWKRIIESSGAKVD